MERFLKQTECAYRQEETQLVPLLQTMDINKLLPLASDELKIFHLDDRVTKIQPAISPIVSSEHVYKIFFKSVKPEIFENSRYAVCNSFEATRITTNIFTFIHYLRNSELKSTIKYRKSSHEFPVGLKY